MAQLTSLLNIGAEIGRGHFGVVHEGHDPVHGKVAVKIIHRDPAKPPEAWRDRMVGMLKEAQNLKKASHRNVVPVYHLCATDDGEAMLYVMAFCDGGSLHRAFEQGPIDLVRVRSIATDATTGLEALHARAMIHRDIKPANLLIDAKGCIKLADFGLVTDQLVLGYAAAAGYRDHLAPEVIAGKNTSARSDIWALGVTFYRLLHGGTWYQQMPAPRDSVPDGGFANTLNWLPHVPKDWRRFIRQMLRDEPHDRYQTASEVMNALSGLTVQPNWSCVVVTDKISWKREKAGRRILVEWDLADPKRTQWRAWSEPLAPGGRNRILGGNPTALTKRNANAELRKFFESQS
jgi:serine/threonine-protein kinase